MHWVYRGALTPAHFSPVLLALSVVLLLRADRSWTNAWRWAVACGYVGLLSAGFAEEAWHLRVWLIAGALGYGGVWYRQRTLGLLLVWPVMGAAAALGHTPGVMVERIVYAAEQSWRVLRYVTPRTAASWGVTTVTLAFVTLGVGAWSSARLPRGGGGGAGVNAAGEKGRPLIDR